MLPALTGPCVTDSMRGEQGMGETVIYSGIHPGRGQVYQDGTGEDRFQTGPMSTVFAKQKGPWEEVGNVDPF